MPEVVLYSPEHGQWMRYAHPLAVFCVHEPAHVLPLLEELEARVEADGLHAAGMLSYEAGRACDPALPVPRYASSFPLLWFGLFRAPRPVQPVTGDPCPPLVWTPELREEEHGRALARIHELLAAGETYQVNFTYRMRTGWAGDAWAYWCRLLGRQPSPHAAYVDTGEYAVCCASPESFFERNGETVFSRPMKGTAGRGRWTAEDERARGTLLVSVKDRAENVMIVDMVRNDLGRVCRPGSVRVPELFRVERHPTVWQMTSLVQGLCDRPTHELLRALFPAASITGAPKVRTMQLISEMEQSARNIYTGTIGVLKPGRQARFNVAIRTVLVDRTAGRAEYGVGGGIVWDSDPAAEYRETRIKARVLERQRSDFHLIETMRWTRREGCPLRERHLRRLADSAAYFDFVCDADGLQRLLDREIGELNRDACVLRVLLDREGGARVEYRDLPVSTACRVALAPFRVDSNDPLLFHKTSQRLIYDRARAERPDVDDVLLVNDRDEVTEATIANVVCELDGERVTPALECGLLPGVMRAELLDRGEIREAVIRVDDLPRITGMWLINAVRGWRRAELTD